MELHKAGREIREERNMPLINVKGLKELIKDLPEDALILYPIADHQYRRAYGSVETVAIYTWPEKHFVEDFGELNPNDGENEERGPPKIVKAVIIS